MGRPADRGKASSAIDTALHRRQWVFMKGASWLASAAPALKAEVLAIGDGDTIRVRLVMLEDGQALAYRRYLGGCDARQCLDAEWGASRRSPQRPRQR